MRRIAIIAMLAMAFSAVAVQAQQTALPVAPVKPFVDAQTVLVIQADLSRIDAEAFLRKIGQQMQAAGLARPAADAGAPAGQELVDQNRQSIDQYKTWVETGIKDVFMVASMANLTGSGEPLVIIPLRAGADAEKIRALLLESGGPDAVERVGDVLIAGNEAGIAAAKAMTAQPRPELEQALAAGGQAPVRAAFLINDNLRTTAAQALALAPEPVAASATPALAGAQWLGAGVDLTPEVNLQLVLQSKDADAARSAQEAIGTAFQLAQQNQDLAMLLPRAGELAKLLSPRLKDTQLTLTLTEQQIGTIIREHVLPAVMMFAMQKAFQNGGMEPGGPMVMPDGGF